MYPSIVRFPTTKNKAITLQLNKKNKNCVWNKNKIVLNILWNKPDLAPGQLADYTCPAGDTEVYISHFQIFSVFEILFDPNFGLFQRMLPKRTYYPQFLCMSSAIFFCKLADLLMYTKTFGRNMIISKKQIFENFKT